MKTLLQKWIITNIILGIFFITPAMAQKLSWHAWKQNLRHEAIADGISPQLFNSIFSNMTPSRKHIRLDRSQPEKRLTYYKYRNTRGDRYRINIGRREIRRYRGILNEVSNKFAVSPCFIVALWGLESSYGRFMGNFNVLRSLATLAYDGRRSTFFRKELLLALHMVQDGHVNAHEFKGEWAGASGQSQFLPSSWYKYAIDYNGDGHKDIWKTHSDIFASIANYLASNGWQQGQPVALRVTLPSHFDHSLITLKIKKPVHVWQQLGVSINPGQQHISGNTMASILKPYGGPTWMVLNNFRVLMRWNYSSYYAGTVAYVAREICKG